MVDKLDLKGANNIIKIRITIRTDSSMVEAWWWEHHGTQRWRHPERTASEAEFLRQFACPGRQG